MPLKLVKRKGSPNWYIRGTLRGLSVNESTDVDERKAAEEILIVRSREILERSIHGDALSRTFGEATLNYIEEGGAPAHLNPLLKHFGKLKLAQIGQAEIDAAAKKLCPGKSPATVNRQVYTPVVAVLYNAARKGWCPRPLIRRPKQPPGRLRWITHAEAERLIEAAAPHIKPIVIFLLSDGLTSVLDGMNGSFTKFFDGIASGTEKPKKAFQTLGASIFQSLMEAASKMLANQMIKEIFSLGTSFFGGGGYQSMPGGGIGAIGPTFWQGGYVRRAQGGMMGNGIATRDSIPTLLAPGEFVMNQDAVSTVGAKTLAAINSAGNGIRANTPTVAQAMPARQPDTANVYVVAPEAKPQMGKRDVVAAISEDMLSNGQTKKLVQAIQMGSV